MAVWFPFLPIDRIRRERQGLSGARPDEALFALTEPHARGLVLAALDQAALRAGLRPGMTLAEARALVPQLRTGDSDHRADRRALEACADACERFTPLVALDGPDGLLLDITGCAHLFGGEAVFPFTVRRRMRDLGFATRAAMAGTPDAARAAARFGEGGVIAPGYEAEAARPLPVAALMQDQATTTALIRAGLRHLGDLADRPMAALTARFGAGLTTTLRRILGAEDPRITPRRPLPDCLAERHLSEPVMTMEAVLAILSRLAAEVMRQLERRGEGGREFEAGIFRVDGAARYITIEMAQASRDADSLMRLLRLRIEALGERLEAGFGFDAIRLAVLRTETLNQRQVTLAAPAGRDALADAHEVATLIDRLVARFGAGRVQGPGIRDSHDPVRAGTGAPVLAGAEVVPAFSPEPGQPPLRPLTLFEPPQLIEALAEVPDGPPLRFRWRRILHDVARAEGPERIAPEWWRTGQGAPTRDYYRIENAAGNRFWVFREGLFEDSTARPRWFLHGLFA